MELADTFKIYIDRLRSGKREELTSELDVSFLDVGDKDLRFLDSVRVEGEAYATDDDLVLHLDSFVSCEMPCSVCNEKVKVDVKVQDFYHVESFDKIKSGVFDYTAPLREAILLETPAFIECNDGHCSKRSDMESYFCNSKSESRMKNNPFSELTVESKENEHGSTT